jgi:uncharacterized membrane protein
VEVKMSNPQVSTAPSISFMALRSGLFALAVVAGIFLILGPGFWAASGRMIAAAHPHAPRLDLIAAASLPIKIHLATVLAAFALATVQMLGPKGRTMHRILGWTLVALLLTTAVASIFIRNPHDGPINPLQVFSVWTLVAIPLAVYAARRRNVVFHARMMTGFYMGALVVAGLLTFIPGRLMWRVFFG